MCSPCRIGAVSRLFTAGYFFRRRRPVEMMNRHVSQIRSINRWRVVIILDQITVISRRFDLICRSQPSYSFQVSMSVQTGLTITLLTAYTTHSSTGLVCFHFSASSRYPLSSHCAFQLNHHRHHHYHPLPSQPCFPFRPFFRTFIITAKTTTANTTRRHLPHIISHVQLVTQQPDGVPASQVLLFSAHHFNLLTIYVTKNTTLVAAFLSMRRDRTYDNHSPSHSPKPSRLTPSHCPLTINCHFNNLFFINLALGILASHSTTSALLTHAFKTPPPARAATTSNISRPRVLGQHLVSLIVTLRT